MRPRGSFLLLAAVCRGHLIHYLSLHSRITIARSSCSKAIDDLVHSDKIMQSCHLHFNNLLDILSHLYPLQSFCQVVDFIVYLGDGADGVLLERGLLGVP